MRMLARGLALGLILILVACGVTPPTEPTAYARFHLAAAESTRDDSALRESVHIALSVPEGRAVTRQTFLTKPAFAQRYIQASALALRTPATVHAVEWEQKNLRILRDAGAVPPEQADALLLVLNDASARANRDESLRFTLKSYLQDLAFAQDPTHIKIMVERTIALTSYSSQAFERDIPGLMAYAANPATPRAEKERIRSFLPVLRVRPEELAAVQAVFPTCVPAGSVFDKRLSGAERN